MRFVNAGSYADPASLLTAGTDRESFVTRGNFVTEIEAEADLDARLEWTELFHVYKQVRGYYLHPRPGVAPTTPRVDRLLMPKARLLNGGWRGGAVAVECKASGTKLGPPLAQALDYSRAAFEILGGALVIPTWTFLWPAAATPIAGTLESLMCQNRIGQIFGDDGDPLTLHCGGAAMLRVNMDKTFSVKQIQSGNKAGSR